MDAYICGHDHNMQMFHDNRLAHYHSGMGVKFNPSKENIDDPRIPQNASKFWTVFDENENVYNMKPRDIGCDPLMRDWCDDDQVGFIMFYLNEKKLSGRIMRGDGTEHFQFDIIKKTAV